MTAGSLDLEPEGLGAGPQDTFYSLTQQYVLSAYYVPGAYKKSPGTGDVALNKTDNKSLPVRNLYSSEETDSQ